MMKKTTPEEAVAATTVFWDINKCPVPLGVDVCQVGPSIKRFLKNLGYSGPLTINAIGLLTHVPEAILRAVSCTGIVLTHVPRGTEDIKSLLFVWRMENRYPANVMVISTSPTYSSVLSYLSKSRVNVIYPFPNVFPREASSTSALSLWNNFLLAASEAPEEDKCSETGELSALWVCDLCNKSDGQGFENCMSHLSGREHALMLPFCFSYTGSFEAKPPLDSCPSRKATPEDAVAATSVFWDINRCPVPDGLDACQVGPLIKQFLKKLGYSGPLTINAVGILTHVSQDILQDISSTGIVLYHVPCGSKDMERLLSRCSIKDKSPVAANVMVISIPPSYSSVLSTLSERGLNVIYPLPYDSPQETPSTYAESLEFDFPRGPPSSYVESLWNNFAWEASDKCMETSKSSASWVCLVCHNHGRGFENFIIHLSSREHARELPRWFSEIDKEALEVRAEGPLHSYPDNASRKAMAKAMAKAKETTRNCVLEEEE